MILLSLSWGTASGPVPGSKDMDWSALENDLQSFGSDYQVEFKAVVRSGGVFRMGFGMWRNFLHTSWNGSKLNEVQKKNNQR